MADPCNKMYGRVDQPCDKMHAELDQLCEQKVRLEIEWNEVYTDRTQARALEPIIKQLDQEIVTLVHQTYVKCQKLHN